MPLAAIIVELENFTPPPPPKAIDEDYPHLGLSMDSEQSVKNINPSIGAERFFS
jgi:hypothetical protein